MVDAFERRHQRCQSHFISWATSSPLWSKLNQTVSVKTFSYTFTVQISFSMPKFFIFSNWKEINLSAHSRGLHCKCVKLQKHFGSLLSRIYEINLFMLIHIKCFFLWTHFKWKYCKYISETADFLGFFQAVIFRAYREPNPRKNLWNVVKQEIWITGCAANSSAATV